MVVLVSGGAGYLGSLLIREIPKQKRFEGETVRILDNMFRDRYVSLFDLPSDCTYEVVYGDVTRKEDVDFALKDVTTVFSLSDITNAPLSFERKELTRAVNYEGALNLYRRAVQMGVESYVYTSTASVYGTTDGVVDETYDCKPISPYGIYKLQAEREMQAASKENGVQWTALRLGTVVGWTIGMRFDTVINRFTFLASIGARLTVWENALREARPYVEVRDVIRAYFFADANKSMRGEVYNVVAENLNISQVVDRIREFFPETEIIVSPTPHLNQVSYVLSSEKIRRLGFDYKFDVRDGIESIAVKLGGLKKMERAPPDVPT
ncbi:MAG: NAD-dependent epimerase/dehydratase family protein [Candidatus Thorarchaeota archaeon]